MAYFLHHSFASCVYLGERVLRVGMQGTTQKNNLLAAVSFEKPGNLGHQRIVGIWVAQQGADREKDLPNMPCMCAANILYNYKIFTLLMVRAGDHCDLSMSRQIEPFELMFGW